MPEVALLPESAPSSSISSRMRNWIHRHALEGRKEEYLSKWNHVMEGVSGLPRFELEKHLSDEASKYARDRVIRDVLVAAAATVGTGVGIADIVALKNPERIRKLFMDLGAKVAGWATEKATSAASEAAKAGLKGTIRAIKGKGSPDLVTQLAREATTQAATGVQQAAENNGVQTAIATAAFDTTSMALQGVTAAAEAHVLAAPKSLMARLLYRVSSALSLKK